MSLTPCKLASRSGDSQGSSIMAKTIISAALFAVLAFSGRAEAAAGFTEDLRQCRDGETPQQRVEGCMAVIEWGRLQGDALAAAFVSLGNALEQSGEPARAAAALNEAIRLNPEAGRYHYLRAMLVARHEGCKTAMPDFDRAIALGTDGPEVHYFRGVCYETADAARALVDFDTAMRKDQSFVPAYFGRAAALAEMGRYDEALASAQAGVALAPDKPDSYVSRAGIHVMRGETVLAKADLAKALGLDPAFVPALGGLAELTYKDGQLETALGYYDRILAIQPSNPVILNNRCYLEAELGRLEDALRHCEASIAAGANEVNLDSRGFVHLKRGDFQLAHADFDAALAQDPKLPSSLYGRGLARLRLGQTDEGQADLAAASAIDAEIAAFYDKNGLKP